MVWTKPEQIISWQNQHQTGYMSLSIKDKTLCTPPTCRLLRTEDVYPTNANMRWAGSVYAAHFNGRNWKAAHRRKIIWITPPGSSVYRACGVGVQFSDQDGGTARNKIWNLSGRLFREWPLDPYDVTSLFTMLIDSHCHLDRIDLAPYQNDFACFMKEAANCQIEHLLCIAIDLENYPAMLALVSAYPQYPLRWRAPQWTGWQDPALKNSHIRPAG